MVSAGMRAGDVEALLAQPLDRGHDDLDLLAAQRAVLAGMRVEPGDGEPRRFDAELALQPARRARGP